MSQDDLIVDIEVDREINVIVEDESNVDLILRKTPDIIVVPTGGYGPIGPEGPAGPAGPAGTPGTPGTPGTNGAPGATGATGSQGPKGDTGNTGGQGSQGIQGVKGDTGDTGPQGPAGNVTVGTSLPGSPANNDEYVLVDSLTAPTWAWHFKYLTAISDAYKWLCLGPVEVVVQVDTAQACTSASYVDLTTAGPSFTVPRAGIYIVEFGATAVLTTGGTDYDAWISVKVGAAGADDADSFNLPIKGAGFPASGSRKMTRTYAASTALKLQYRNYNTTSQTYSKRWLSIKPLRVS